MELLFDESAEVALATECCGLRRTTDVAVGDFEYFLGTIWGILHEIHPRLLAELTAITQFPLAH